ncbi:MAG: hypothetical protein Q8868_10220 [Bacteroidota bacterium]|nr:hypothetical protein [Bacteroidota bacterium]
MFFLLLAASLISSASISQEIVFPQLSGFRIRTDYPVYKPDNLWDFIDGAAEAYLSFDFVDLHVAEYKKGKQVIKVEIYRHKDHTMAFGIYSSERSPSFRFTSLGTQGYTQDGATNFFKGNYYVKIKTFSKKPRVLQAAETLAAKVAASLVGETTMPSVLELFPPEGKKANEEIYINTNVLGHSFLNNAFRADYEAGSDAFSVYMINCSSPEEAKKTASTYIAATGIDQIETGDSRFVLSDGYNGSVFLAWKDNRIVIIAGLAKDQAGVADKYTSQILK